MYNTATAITMSLRDLLEKVDDYTIYSYYIGEFKVGQLINSPLRNDDKMPSFAVFRGRNGDLLFKDHGTGEAGNAFKFLKLKSSVRTREELERELLKIVKRTNISPNTVKVTREPGNDLYGADIGIVRQPFTEVDKAYWKQFHISLETLRKFQVFSIKYFLCNRVVRGTYKETNPMYAYKVYDKFKIYRPLASKYTKWRTNLTNRHVQGLAELPDGSRNLLVITKSLKDVMCLYEMGIDAISPSSETTFIPDDILDSLKKKYTRIVILFDRDRTGMLKSRQYSKQHGFRAIFINKRYNAKDVSDAVKANGFNEIKSWLLKTLDTQ